MFVSGVTKTWDGPCVCLTVPCSVFHVPCHTRYRPPTAVEQQLLDLLACARLSVAYVPRLPSTGDEAGIMIRVHIHTAVFDGGPLRTANGVPYSRDVVACQENPHAELLS